MTSVLFISSGNLEAGISPIVRNQAESLKNSEYSIEYFTIVGKGFRGYLKNIMQLRRYTRKYKYDIIHAHYFLSALVAILAGCKPLVVSLMGSDLRMGLFFNIAIKISSKYFINTLIVKSIEMKENIGVRKCEIIPNGVNLKLFKPLDKNTALKKLKWNKQKNHILFGSSPTKLEKNYQLLKKAYGVLCFTEQLELHILENINPNDIPIYINASDLLILTSLWEGSPNVIKESMACNCPVVSTDVGDVRWLFGNEPGHYITSYDPEDVAKKIKLALEFSGKYCKTNGRKRIIELGLDSETIANKILNVYKTVLQEK